MKAVFFSDAHLTSKDHERIGLVGRFIADVCRDADVVVVVGDLFEFYHGYNGFIYPWYRPVADALRAVSSGRDVYFLEGNHEFGMGDYFEKYTGVRCMEEAVLDFDGKRVFVSHGDTLGAGSLKPILKSALVYLLMHLLRPRLTWGIAMGCRHFLSRRKKGYSKRVLGKFRHYGRDKLQHGYDAVVLAHSHMPDILSFTEGGKQKVYLNTGDLIKNLSYGEYTSDGGFQLKIWDPRC